MIRAQELGLIERLEQDFLKAKSALQVERFQALSELATCSKIENEVIGANYKSGTGKLIDTLK
jgi:hypothetical protein